MDIHRFEKLWIGIALLLIIGFISTVAYGSLGPGVKMIDNSGGTIDAGEVQAGTSGTGFDDPGVTKTGPNEYEVYVKAQQFQFVPGTSQPIELPAGSTVTFYVTATDVTHGFNIAGTNVNTMVIPGQVAELTVNFEEPGSYGIVCNEYCGGGHHTMEGRLEVLPQSAYNSTEGA
ncbi:cytochrome C oxidase subunit II [Halorhabdus sp. CBA1104]|uniref:cytochrome c oxidase subunit II n=1 Tax=unclassified Halorhabdus TaxID=2621901 RepID=UPI0012B23FB6|nr:MULTISPECIES: cytochrome c oxidase subunit II [unclassified Halorhabdus]QGN06971.1 cytochrome C oxidase subunit II [Halorhabdus sp. CBA1104]